MPYKNPDEHREEARERSRLWAKNNPERRKKYKKQYYIENREHFEQYYIENREETKKRNAKYYVENKKEILEYNEQYHIENKEKIKEKKKLYEAKRRKINLMFNLNSRMSIAIYKSLKENKNGRHWENLVGYTRNDLMEHLMHKIPEGYSEKDIFNGNLHIDHKIPKSVFNYSKPEHPDFKECWALDNLRLLPAKENLIKSKYLNRPFQPSLKLVLGV